MHPILFIPLGAFLGACVVASAAVARDPGSRARRLAGAIVGCAGLAAALEIAWCSVESAAAALVLMRIAALATLVIGPLCMETVCEAWPELEERLRIPRVLAAGTAAGLGLLVLESSRLVAEAAPVEWGFVVRGGNLMWLVGLHTLACVALLLGRLRDLDDPAWLRRRGDRRFLRVAGWLVVGACGLDLVLSLQSLATPRFTAPAVVLAGALLWRLGRGEDDGFHPGAFDAEIFDALADGVAVLRDDGSIRAVNSSLEALAQAPRRQLIDRPLSELMGEIPEELGACLEWHTTLEVDGAAPIPVSITSAALRDRQGSVIGCAVAIRDRSEIVDLKRHLVTSARFAAVGELAAGIANEVNSPLAFIQANLNQLQRNYSGLREQPGDGDPRDESVFAVGEGLIQDCLVGIAEVASIVSEVRGFAHGGEEASRLCDVNALLETSMRMVLPPGREGTRVERCYAELPAVRCREQDLKQLFLGLLMHAAQPSRSAETLRLSTEATDGTVRVWVEDDGAGYTEEELDRVFDPVLDEGDAVAKEGMGLSIAYHIAQQLGGEIELESEPEGWTRVGVILPCEAPQTHAAADDWLASSGLAS